MCGKGYKLTLWNSCVGMKHQCQFSNCECILGLLGSEIVESIISLKRYEKSKKDEGSYCADTLADEMGYLIMWSSSSSAKSLCSIMKS